MKKIHDISRESKGDIVLNCNKQIYIQKADKPIRDISRSVSPDILIKQHHEIQISPKKKCIHTDALHKKGKFSLGKSSNYLYVETLSDTIRKRMGSCEENTFSPTRKKLIIALILFIFFPLYVFLSLLIVESQVSAGYSKLFSIETNYSDRSYVNEQLRSAKSHLSLAAFLYAPYSIIPNGKLRSIHHTIQGGLHISKAGYKSLDTLTSVESFVIGRDVKGIYFSQLLENIEPELSEIGSHIKKSKNHYEAVTWLPSGEYETDFMLVREILSKSDFYSSYLIENYDTLLDMLGHQKRKKYLVVLQNSDEIRPMGGFMGSIALIEIFKGRVELFQKRDIYSVEWDLKKADYERKPAPKGLDRITEKFGLRDANYFVDVEESTKAIDFFMRESGIEIDGIIYINQNILLEILKENGGVDFPKIGMTITHENFSELMSISVEGKQYQDSTLGSPKQILFDFIELYLTKLQAEQNYDSIAQIILKNVLSRDITLRSMDDSYNNFFENYNLGGIIDYEKTFDFMYPVYTSISGNKSDRYMKREYHVHVTNGDSCSFIVRNEIISRHTMELEDQNRVLGYMQKFGLESSPDLFSIQGASKNSQYVRILYPQNGLMRSRNDYSIENYGTRSGLELFIETPLMQKSEFSYNYTLENPQCETYSFALYKQPGIAQHSLYIYYDGELHSYKDKNTDIFFYADEVLR